MPSPPNILIIMSDQHSAAWSGAYGHPFLHTPAIDRLAAEGATFDNAYCNSPICAPSRASFMTGRLVSEIAAWDNGTPFGSDQPTWAHALNSAGYETALCGKMHFIGPDQMHGFQRRLLSDVHGSGNPRLIANWDSPNPSSAAMDRSAFDESGPGDSTYQQYDDAVANRSAAYLAEAARHERPWALCASFITPHNPLIVRQQYWDQYFPDHADQPTIAPHKETLHPHNRGMGDWFDFHDVEPEKMARGRAAYYGLVTFCDERIGQVLDALDASGQSEDTLVIYVSDHGELNGEHGLWNKQSFYEHSSHIPMIIRWPGHIAAGRRIDQVTSLVDLAATIVDLSGSDPLEGTSGSSLLPLLRDAAPQCAGSAISEYFAVGTVTPARMLRNGPHKLHYYHNQPLELFDLYSDPDELTNLADDSAHADVQERLLTKLLTDWDPDDLDRRIRASQRDRLLIAAGDSVHGIPAWKPGSD
jgi:choline-sulfatase